MDVVVLIGRILFVALFIGAGVNHLSKVNMLAGFASSKGVPAAKVVVAASGVVLLLGGLSVLLGIWADLGALLLVVFLVPTAVTMHNFWTIKDPQARQGDMTHFQKDLALAGAALMLFALFVKLGDDLGLTITGPLFG